MHKNISFGGRMGENEVLWQKNHKYHYTLGNPPNTNSIKEVVHIDVDYYNDKYRFFYCFNRSFFP